MIEFYILITIIYWFHLNDFENIVKKFHFAWNDTYNAI